MSEANTNIGQFPTRPILYILVVPWDYSTADAIVFTTRKSAEMYRDSEVEEKARPYARIEEYAV